MLNWLKLSHHYHSGRLRPHEHTSYLPLGLLLLVVGFVLTAFTASAASPGPESGSIGLTGTVPAKPPTVAAVIIEPGNQQRFSTSPVKVSGTCPANTLVELFKNDIFAGSTPCTAAGTFALDVDLMVGNNILIARVYDVLNQPGPDSNAVTVFYDALPHQAAPSTSLGFSGTQLLLSTDAVFRGSFPEQDFTMPIDILGGTPPYAVNVQWGDSTNKVIARNDSTTFKVAHAYQKPGTYQISLQATDAGGRVAFLTVAAIVNGQPSVAAGTTASNTATNKLLMLWPFYISILAIVASFWLGEQREKHILSKHGQLLPL
jgi:hypothetical protein